MKKLNAFALAMCAALVVAAQEKPKFGLKAGLNVATLKYSNNAEADYRSGFHVGALAHVHITPSFSLQPEIYYSSQGAKIPYNGDKMNLGLDYINVPVLLQYNFANGFRLQGGPQVGFLVGVSDKVNGAEMNAYTTDNFKTVEVAIPLGVSYLGYSGFGIDARYNIGLSNINQVTPPTAKNKVFQVGAFYLFDHKHKVESRKKK
ncbi:porin family protein [Flavisolibacter nicotianae]|uniref:porin family protein n=1 Tax=Flavisolibacter nicotianae TaxID=2364882 RepID=UPI0013C4337F|nr:porin family protein [Flavisolibacter nicotianae]